MTAFTTWELFIEEPLQPAEVGGFSQHWYDAAEERCVELAPVCRSNRYAIWSFSDSETNDSTSARWRFLRLLHTLSGALHRNGGLYSVGVNTHNDAMSYRLARSHLSRLRVPYGEAGHGSWVLGHIQDIGSLFGTVGQEATEKVLIASTHECGLLTPVALTGEGCRAVLDNLLLDRWPGQEGQRPSLFVVTKDFFSWCLLQGYVLMLFTSDERHAFFPTFYSATPIRPKLVEATTLCLGRPVETHFWQHHRR